MNKDIVSLEGAVVLGWELKWGWKRDLEVELYEASIDGCAYYRGYHTE
jgi:hypothetical protein